MYYLKKYLKNIKYKMFVKLFSSLCLCSEPKKNIKEKIIIIEDLNNNKINDFEILNLKIGKSLNNHINNSNLTKKNNKIGYLSPSHNNRLNKYYHNQQNISHISKCENKKVESQNSLMKYNDMIKSEKLKQRLKLKLDCINENKIFINFLNKVDDLIYAYLKKDSISESDDIKN